MERQVGKRRNEQIAVLIIIVVVRLTIFKIHLWPIVSIFSSPAMGSVQPLLLHVSRYYELTSNCLYLSTVPFAARAGDLIAMPVHDSVLGIRVGGGVWYHYIVLIQQSRKDSFT